MMWQTDLIMMRLSWLWRQLHAGFSIQNVKEEWQWYDNMGHMLSDAGATTCSGHDTG